jgi:superfamily II DNA/RNA helicase
VPRRDFGDVLIGDPFLDRFESYRSYRCIGQREAIRAVLTAPGGSTLAVNLPTGSGKSLAAYLPSLLDSTGLTVVVVPTTALAIDQERAVASYVSHPTAFYSSSDGEASERNLEIIARIRKGTQRLVFTSPESLIHSLAAPLYVVAVQGLLKVLAIDEAHIVDQWGDEFRPEFQEIVGLRRDLLRTAPDPKPLTLLLSGTMTESCVDTLETLFGKPGPFALISAVQLRPEPSYWATQCHDEGLREARVREAICRLSRPLILYVSRVEDANRWHGRLRESGFRRVTAVTGGTSASDRSEALRAFQADELDIVVATSAFGLGVDKADVRAVIHACLPEHLDRFYQEVGRGGRDGLASVSLLVTVPSDRAIAHRLNQRNLISTVEDKENKGYERWKAMYARRKTLGSGRIRVPLVAIPDYGFGRFENNTANVAWNLRTLTLLARAGVIELDAEPPPNRHTVPRDAEGLDEARFLREFERHKKEKVVRILGDEHLELRAWRGAIEKVRGESIRAAERGLELMLEAVNPRRCLAELFSEAYEIPERKGTLPRGGAFVSRSCGGCPACRSTGKTSYVGTMPTPAPPWMGRSLEVSAELQSHLGQAGRIVVFDEKIHGATGIERMRREGFLRFVLASGFRTVVASPERLAALRSLVNGPGVPPVFFSEDWETLYLPATPALFIEPPEGVIGSLLDGRDTGAGSVAKRFVWLSAERTDPAKPHCLLRHTVTGPAFRFEEFCKRVGL